MDFKEYSEQMQKAFADFKAANEERIAQIEKKGKADPLLEAKVDAVNAKITELSDLKAQIEAGMQKIQRLSLGGGNAQSEGDIARAEHRKAFKAFLRKGQDAGLRQLEIKAVHEDVNTVTDDEGGYGVPEELDRTVGKLLTEASPMRQVCLVQKVGVGYVKLFSTGSAAGGWVGEVDARPQTGAPGLAALAPVFGEVYANPASTQRALDDIFFDVEAWLAEEVAKTFTLYENTAFTTGAGVAGVSPKGLFAYSTATTADATRAFGTLQHVITGAAAAWATASATVNPADALINLVMALKSGHRNGAIFMMPRSIVADVRKFKDSVNGAYIWQPGIQVGQPSSLLGYGIVENEDMSGMGAGNLIAAFGNFKTAFGIYDVGPGVRVLRDPFTSKPYILFYSTKRVGSMLLDSEAVKILKVSA